MQAEPLTSDAVPIAASPAYPALPTSWLLNGRADVVSILVAGPIISLVLLVAVMQQGPAFLICAMLFALLLDLPHVLHTHVRIFANPADYERVRRHFWWSLAVISVVCISLALADQFALLLAIWVFWQPYHVCKQHYGVATMYGRKAGYKGSTNHVLWLVLTGFAAPLLYRMFDGGFQFGNYELFGAKFPFSGIKVPTPPVAFEVVVLAYITFALAIGHFIRRERSGSSDGRSLPKFVWVMLAVSLCLYNAAYLFVGDLYALILIGTSIHAIQYHLVCVSSVRSVLPQATISPTTSSPVLYLHRWVERYGKTRMVWVALLVISAAILVTEAPTLGVIPLIIVLHHFYLDGVIWKRKSPK